MSLSPNYDVPEGVSPFTPLSQLIRCAYCREPQNPLHLWSAVHGGKVVRDLCERCATTNSTPKETR